MQDKVEKEYEEPKDREKAEGKDEQVGDHSTQEKIPESSDEYTIPHLLLHSESGYPEFKAGKRFPLEGEQVLIGTSASAHICLPQGLAEPEHVCLYQHDGWWYLRDITDRLRGVLDELDATLYRLRDGERFLVGSLEFVFFSGTGPETSQDEERFRQCSIDPISQALNRPALYKKMSQDMVSCVQKGRWIGILLMDIDHFSQLNTTYGCLAGDEVLRQLQKRIRPKIRQDESIARFRGGTFAFISPKSDRIQAIDMAERLRKLILSTPISYGDVQIQITVSIGVSSINRIVDQNHLIRIADRNLYDAKQSGRNQVRG